MRRELFALIGMVIGIILIIMAFFVPWYSTIGSAGTETMSSDIYLQRMTMNSPITGEVSTGYEGREGIEYVANTMYLTIGALIMAILSLIGISGIYFKFGNVKNMRTVGLSFGILTFIFAIISILYFMMGTLDAMKQSSDVFYGAGQTPLGGSTPGFWWNINVMGMEISAAPGFAWYIMIIAGLIALISAALILKKSSPESSSHSDVPTQMPDN